MELKIVLLKWFLTKPSPYGSFDVNLGRYLNVSDQSARDEEIFKLFWTAGRVDKNDLPHGHVHEAVNLEEDNESFWFCTLQWTMEC